MKDFFEYVNHWRDAYPIETATRFAFCETIGDRLNKLTLTLEDISAKLEGIASAISGQEGDLK